MPALRAKLSRASAVRASICALLLACDTTVSSRAAVLVVRVRDDVERPLAGVAIEVDGVKIGNTDARGALESVLGPEPSSRVRLAARCPAGFREENARVIAVERASAARLAFDFVCRPAQRTLVVVVRASGAEGSVVRADGEALGQVASDGTLHAVLTRRPDAELRLSIENRDPRPLVPTFAERHWLVPDHDELLLFDQVFKAAPRGSRSSRARADVRARRELPYRIEPEGLSQ